MTFVYPEVAIAAGVLGLNRLRRAPNVQCESCLSDEDEFLSTHLSARQIHQLALEYIRWRRQVDRANVRYYTSTEHMKLFLRYLARGGYYHQVRRAEGLAESSAMVNLHKAAAFFQHTAATYKLPRLVFIGYQGSRFSL